MLIIALLGAFIFYIGIYLLWENVPLNSLQAILEAVNRMFWLPTTTIFTIYRGILLVAVAYVILDLFFSGAKRATRRRNNKEKNEISWKKPPPSSDQSG